MSRPRVLYFFPRCRLCRYKVEEGDDVVVVSADGYKTAPFAYHHGSSHVDRKWRRKIQCCSTLREDMGRHEPAIGCHSRCLTFLTKLEPSLEFRCDTPLWPYTEVIDKNSKPSGIDIIDASTKNNLHRLYDVRLPVKTSMRSFNVKGLLRSTGIFKPAFARTSQSSRSPMHRLYTTSLYWYDPPISEDERRLRVSTDLLCDLLRHKIGRDCKLPTEIWRMIAMYFSPYEYAIASLLWTAPYRGESAVVLSEDIWATYVWIDGVAYVSSLSYDPSPGAKPIFEAGSKRGKIAFYIMEDHLGIRQVHISSTPPVVDSSLDRSTWWRVHPVENMDDEFVFSSDGIKLQQLTTPSPGRDTKPRHIPTNCSWSEPLPLSELAALSLMRLNSRLGVPRFLPFAINEADCTGYTACWIVPRNLLDERGTALLHLHAHKRGEDQSFYKETANRGGDLVWTYMPMKSGERVDQIWCRHGNYSFDVTLALKTSMGRILTAGPFKTVDFTDSSSPWTCIAQLSTTGSSRLWLDGPHANGQSVTSIAGPMRSKHPKKTLPVHIMAASSFAYPVRAERSGTSFHSSASLENVEEIVLSRLQTSSRTWISGMLFHYENGDETAVGDFRLDAASRHIRVVKSSRLYLGMVESHVSGINIVSPNTGSLTWKSFPWSGSLHWWFTPTTCYVEHSKFPYVNGVIEVIGG
ncbi:unnamed protein product [Clonostachys rosea]|uniref:Heterokaryon incompatibility domain-containing protein n=1 Tax=Bionectria ochroleuca TaxID=29856 RepID=A0ABY6UHZ2_BIOOC|nr:unnamed protein product [Clonostachys rosea]